MSTAAAQTTPLPYQFIDLGPTPFVPGVLSNRVASHRFGINSKGWVAYTRLVNGVPHAYLFVPQDDTMTTSIAPGFYDLHTLGGLGSNDESWASDVSDDGIVIGSVAVGTGIASVSEATIWSPDTGSFDMQSIHASSILDNTTPYDTADPHQSYGIALTNGALGDDPVAVGFVFVDRCESGEDDNGEYYWGFSAEIPSSGPPSAFYALIPNGGYAVGTSQESFGFDVNESVRAVGGEDGRQGNGSEPEDCLNSLNFSDCYTDGNDNPDEPLAWDASPTPSGPDAMDQIPDPSGPDRGSAAFGVNDADIAVGYGRIVVEEQGCVRRATYYATTAATQSPLVLGDTMPSGQSANESESNAVNEPDEDDCVSIVGGDRTAIVGLIWHGDGSTFCVENLDDITYICGSPGDGETILDAHDINDDRFIVGIMLWSDEGSHLEYPAVLITTAGDISGSSTGVGDLLVDGADLGIVLTDWGMSSSAFAPLSADINCDGTVDGADSGIVLSNWLTTPPAICECGEESLAARSQSSYSEEAFLAAIEDAGFLSIEDASEWASTASRGELNALGELLLVLMNS